GTETISLRTEGEFTGSEQLNALVVGTVNGKELRLSDIAVVKDTIEKITQEFRFNGKKGVQIVIQKQSGSNSVAIANEIKKKLPDLQKTLPQDVELNMLLDSTENITNSINSLAETVMYAFIFVVLVVMLFLGKWRATIIIVCTIPVSLVCGFIYMFATGATLNIISLSSLSIAIGMVVDDAIVVLENINTHIERGSSPKEAAIYATNEVWLAVIATTLTIVAVFVPLTLITGMAGIMFKQLGWIVTIVCCVSTVAAITLTPMMSALMLKVTNPKDKYKRLGIIFKPIEKVLDALDNGYSNLLTWAVRHRALVVIVAAAIFLSSLFLLARVPTELFPSSDNGQISVYVELPQGVNLEYTSKIARQIERIFAEKYPEVKTFGTSAGAAGSNSSIFAAMGKNGSHIINMTLIMKDYKDRDRDIFLLSDLMRQDLLLIPEIKEYTVSPGGGRDNMSGSMVDVKIFGYDFDVTSNFAHELREIIRENVPGTRDITISRENIKPEYKVDFDREKLALYGLNTASVGTMVRNRINGLIASKYREEGEEYDIVVRYDEPFRVSIEDIENIVLYNNRGQGIKLKEVGKVIEYFTPPSIQREDRQRVVTVSVSMYGVALGEVAKGIQAEFAKMNIPQGVDVVFGGSLEDQQEAFTDLITLLILIIILVYIVMATQFESLREPFIIMLAVPFAFTGVFLALFLTNTPLSMIALIGSIMLVGIVVKNGIVLVDYTNLQRDRGFTLSQAVITAGKSRLRPVLMTTLTTILGMVPMAIGSGEGSEIWKPMGIAVIGGLTFSTILTLIVVPVMYSLFGAGRMKKQRKRLAQELQMGTEE
ncbi:MAG: efflux RND transporter permease subunit, partial [Prevotellaceae bacterium]|nr:efflux RND transporter permease subunit [Prevotellaceae bacterium]